jgi:hypothetical protein
MLLSRHTRRRDFITLPAGAAAAWPHAALAEGERLRRIGVLMNLAADDVEGQARLAAFVQDLQQRGWTDGRNVRIDYRWAAGDARLFHRYAEELLALAPDVILASATPSVQALQQATRTVPIVFAMVGDPGRHGRGSGGRSLCGVAVRTPSAEKSGDPPPSNVPPRSARRVLILGSERPALGGAF